MPYERAEQYEQNHKHYLCSWFLIVAYDSFYLAPQNGDPKGNGGKNKQRQRQK